jgi:hypothetical protein
MPFYPPLTATVGCTCAVCNAITAAPALTHHNLRPGDRLPPCPFDCPTCARINASTATDSAPQRSSATS